MPAVLRAAFSDSAAHKLLKGFTDHLTDKGLFVLTELVLKKMGRLAQWRFDLSSLPIESARLDASKRPVPHLTVYVWTNLQVRNGLRERQLQLPVRDDRVSVSIAGSAACAMANQAMRAGTLPARYNESGNPRTDGAYLARLDWKAGDSPLRILVWKLVKACVHVELKATPVFQVKGRRLNLGFDNAAVANVLGPFGADVAVWYRFMARPALSYVQDIASSVRFKLAGQRMEMTITDAKTTRSKVELLGRVRLLRTRR